MTASRVLYREDQNDLPSTEQATKTQPKQAFLSHFSSFFDRLSSVVGVSLCGLTKEISPKMCVLWVRVKINKRSFERFCVWI